MIVIPVFMFMVFLLLYLYLILTKPSGKSSKNIPSYRDCKTCENYNYGVDRCYLGRTPDCCGRWSHIDDDYYLEADND